MIKYMYCNQYKAFTNDEIKNKQKTTFPRIIDVNLLKRMCHQKT